MGGGARLEAIKPHCPPLRQTAAKQGSYRPLIHWVTVAERRLEIVKRVTAAFRMDRASGVLDDQRVRLANDVGNARGDCL